MPEAPAMDAPAVTEGVGGAGQEGAADAAASAAPEPPAPETQTAQAPAPEPFPPEVAPASASAPANTPSAPPAFSLRDLLAKAREAVQGRKRKKLDKILAVLTQKGSITNDEVEKLLHVSDATATRYLSQLEKEGAIRQVGGTGRAVTYVRG